GARPAPSRGTTVPPSRPPAPALIRPPGLGTIVPAGVHPGPRQTRCKAGQSMEQTYFRRGFGLKQAVGPLLDAVYHSALVQQIRDRGHSARFGRITIRLAAEFGFCYGVDRAVEYAYQTAYKFPDRRRSEEHT